MLRDSKGIKESSAVVSSWKQNEFYGSQFVSSSLSPSFCIPHVTGFYLLNVRML